MKKIAVIGSGISGLSMAYILKHNNIQVTLFEKNSYLGGHAKTISSNVNNNNTNIDIGFIVFNFATYPHLTALFNHLQVDIQTADMSFGASIPNNNGVIEYSGKSLWSLFAQPKNLFNFKFYKMLIDIVKFNIKGTKHKDTINSNLSLYEYVKQNKLGDWFVKFYLLPIGGAIWSTKANDMMGFPAKTFLQFFHNHSLLKTFKKHQWYSVVNGSVNYVNKIANYLGNSVVLNSNITQVKRQNNQVIITNNNTEHTFNEVIFACPTYQILHMLGNNITPTEQQLLSNITFKNNNLCVHTDITCMPQKKLAWSAWSYKEANNKDLGLVYWVNVLQKIKTNSNVFISLNANNNFNNVLHTDNFKHPQFNVLAINAQNKLQQIQGKNNTWFAGAYWRYGFHEDGILSAYNIAKQMKLNIPWQQNLKLDL